MSARIRIAAGALMVAGLGLLTAPLPASAHTGALFSWGEHYNSENQDEWYAFGTVSGTDASFALLPEPQNLPIWTTGAEICDESAWAVGMFDDEPVRFTWDHDTGAISEPVGLTADPVDFPDAQAVTVVETWAADSLDDCVGIAYVAYNVVYGPENNVDVLTVAYVNPDGSTLPITELPRDFEQDFVDWMGIATDPTTGTTYLFGQIGNESFYSVLDVDSGITSLPIALAGIQEHFDSSGLPIEADFEPDGRLWLLYQVNALETIHLLTFDPGADLSAGPTDVGAVTPVNLHEWFMGNTVLTYDPYVPVLPATGGVPGGALVAGAALLLAGAAMAGLSSRARRAN